MSKTRYSDYFNKAFAAFDQPGPDIHVSPFAPGTVTGEAGVLKAITSIAAARQARANDAAKRALQAQAAEKVALETQRLRDEVATGAPVDYTTKTGQVVKMTGANAALNADRDTRPEKPAKAPRMVQMRPEWKGLKPDANGMVPYDDAQIADRHWREGQIGARHNDTIKAHQTNVAALNAGLKALDDQVTKAGLAAAAAEQAKREASPTGWLGIDVPDNQRGNFNNAQGTLDQKKLDQMNLSRRAAHLKFVQQQAEQAMREKLAPTYDRYHSALTGTVQGFNQQSAQPDFSDLREQVQEALGAIKNTPQAPSNDE